jgi:hypothetical protein
MMIENVGRRCPVTAGARSREWLGPRLGSVAFHRGLRAGRAVEVGQFATTSRSLAERIWKAAYLNRISISSRVNPRIDARRSRKVPANRQVLLPAQAQSTADRCDPDRANDGPRQKA